MATIEKNKRLTAADRSKIAQQAQKQYASGKSIADIAEGIGTSAGRIRSILLENGVTLRKRGGAVRKPDPERGKLAKKVAQDYGKGARTADLAQEHGVSEGTIRNLVKAGGGTLRPRGGRKSS